MKINTNITSCLSFEKLKAYSENTLEKSESNLLYMHISSCELCACAVNGFSAIPFTSAEMNGLNNLVDVKTNATIAKPLSVSRVLISIISVLSIIGVYNLSKYIGNHNSDIKHISFISNEKTTEEKILLTDNIKIETDKIEVQPTTPALISNKEKENTFNVLNTVSYLPIKEVSLLEKNQSKYYGLSYKYNSNLFYIHDLKVTDYRSLYFTDAGGEFNYKNHTPAYKENKKDERIDLSFETEKYPAHEVLENGLFQFSNKNYRKALSYFSLLLKNNGNDLNAQFYSALCYYNMNKADKSIEQLNKVLENKNNTFLPEAQWYLALSYLSNNEKEKGNTLLKIITKEEGFYSKKAKEKLEK